MSILIEHGVVGLAEADHRIANNLASLSGVIRLQRNAISKSGKTFTAGQVCVLLDDISARIEVMAKLHKSLALSNNGKGVNLGDFLQEIGEMIGTLGPEARMDLTVDNSCDGSVDPRHALHAGHRAPDECRQVCASDGPSCEGQYTLRDEGRRLIHGGSDG